MLSLGPPGAFDSQNIFAPAIARDSGKYYLFYAGGPEGPKTGQAYVRYQLGLAFSDDGEVWTKRGKPLLPLGERDNFHATPALLRDPAGDLLRQDGFWHMVYCGNRADDVEHAVSRNGLDWEKDPRNPIYRAAYAPNVLKVGDEIWMYHVHKPMRGGRASGPWDIHLATGPAWHSLKPDPANPVLTLSQPWERDNLLYPYVLRENSTWIMFYAAYWNGHPRTRAATAIGMATSADGRKWTKAEDNPVLTPTPDSAYDSTYTSSQAVLRDGDGYKLYYGGRINHVHKYFSIGLATCRGRLAVR